MFIKRLEELMRINEISEYKLTQLLHLSKSAIWNWRQGSQPSADKVVLIADFFEVSSDYLLGRSNDVGIIQINTGLSEFERTLLKAVKTLSRDDQCQVLGFAQGLAR